MNSAKRVRERLTPAGSLKQKQQRNAIMLIIAASTNKSKQNTANTKVTLIYTI